MVTFTEDSRSSFLYSGLVINRMHQNKNKYSDHKVPYHFASLPVLPQPVRACYFTPLPVCPKVEVVSPQVPTNSPPQFYYTSCCNRKIQMQLRLFSIREGLG